MGRCRPTLNIISRFYTPLASYARNGEGCGAEQRTLRGCPNITGSWHNGANLRVLSTTAKQLRLISAISVGLFSCLPPRSPRAPGAHTRGARWSVAHDLQHAMRERDAAVDHARLTPPPPFSNEQWFNLTRRSTDEALPNKQAYDL